MPAAATAPNTATVYLMLYGASRLSIIAVCGMQGASASVSAVAITRSRGVSSTLAARMAGTLQPRPSISGMVP